MTHNERYRTCSRCKEGKHVTLFTYTGGRYLPWCKECRREYANDKNAKTRKEERDKLA